MLGQPASSQTVCRPSRRTSDFSSVYSGPVLSRVLIHSGLRSIGTWLLRTSRRSSLRPAGSSGEPEECAGAAVSLMISTVLRASADARPRCSEAAGASSDAGERGQALSSGPPVRRRPPRLDVPVVPGRSCVLVALGHLRGLLAQVGVRRSARRRPRTRASETVLPESLGELGTGSSR